MAMNYITCKIETNQKKWNGLQQLCNMKKSNHNMIRKNTIDNEH